MILWAFIIVFIILVFYIFWRVSSRWISATKTVRGFTVKVRIEVASDLDQLKFKDSNYKKGSEKPPDFIRNNLKKGEVLEFNYVGSQGPVSILAIKKGETRTFEINSYQGKIL